MPYEIGGRADKSGNRFEIRWTIFQIMKVLEEQVDYVILEALGDDEQGVDIWVGNKDGSREGQQCKGRNGSKEYWNYGDANAKGIFRNWKYHLDRDESNTVSLVSPLAFTFLEDLTSRARNTSNIPIDFYNNQILNSSKDLSNFFCNFCKVMNLDPKRDIDLKRSIDYLKRIRHRQYPDTELKEMILSKINYLLIGKEKDTYETFIAWIVDGDILGKEINQSVLYKFLNEKGIELKSLATDNRIIPRFQELNKEYRTLFIPLNDGLVERKEFSICRQAIESQDSLIIHGKAGRGKSGCTEDIINYCEENLIQYLAIKLDKRIPNDSAEKWGTDLGLPASIVHCIHSVSKNQRAVIILDQLDALRWTQAHSRDALLVCSQIINEVEKLNYEREYKISIVFVCRTYDLENDNNIKVLFKRDGQRYGIINWNKIHINEFNDDTVKEIVGSSYEELTNKLKGILRIPSNLYIWQQLDPNREYNECSTASHLVFEWWGQLLIKGFDFGLNENDLNNTKKELVKWFDNSGRIYVPLNVLDINRSCLEFLSSNGFLIIQENKVSFSHQSILDYFLAENMLIRYYANEDIVEIIGTKENQTPGRRYQVQMLMQNLVEFDSQDFLNAGQRIINSNQIRYSIKFIFYEILNQLDNLDENIENYIIENCEDEIHGNHILNNVIYSKPIYIRLLRDCGILDRWMGIPEKKDIVFNLLSNMNYEYEIEDVLFIERYAFQSQEDDNKLSKCFLCDINQDTDEMFELRMKFYNRYPQMADTYLDIKSMLKNCEMRTIRILAFMIENKINNKGKNIYKYQEEFLDGDSDILIKNGMEIINILITYIPFGKDEMMSFSDWSGRYSNNRGLEGSFIQIIKKANIALITLDPETFLDRYKEYMGEGSYLHNEIILDALYQLPVKYSDLVVDYLCSDLDNNIFDKTSGNGDELILGKLILGKFSQRCSQDTFDLLEKTVIRYISPNAKDIYRRKIRYNKETKDYKEYSSYWGDLQKEILEILPYDRLSNYAKDLIPVLKRKFPKGTTRYKYSGGYGGWISSPIGGKNLNNKSWLDILTNKKLNHKRRHNWKEVPGGIIESSIGEFSRSFSNAVSKEPERMVRMIISQDEEILDIYIDSLFSGLAYSESIDDVPIDLLEEMILIYSYDYTSFRANYICKIIEKRADEKWSQKILDIIKDIAVNHENPKIEKPNVTNNEDKEMRSFNMLQSNALNCVRASASRAIGSILWEDKDYLEQFKETIGNLASDENLAVRFSSLFALWPSYNIDKDWTSDEILNLYEQDYRLVGYRDSKNMLFLLYPKYRERVLRIIKRCYESEDEELIKIGGFCLTEMFILKNEFSDEINNVDGMSKKQAEAVLQMVVLYFNKTEYNTPAKDIILKFKTSTLDLEIPISRLFYDNLIDLERDKDFLIDIMSSSLSRGTLHSFIHYIEEESRSLVDYKDIIIPLSYHVIENKDDMLNRAWGIEEEISKLVIGLYDETAESSQSRIRSIANECLNIWDLMFEKQIGSIRRLSQKMMER